MKKPLAIFVVGLSVVLAPSLGYARICGKLYKSSTQTWEHGCYLNPTKDPSKFIPDEVQPGQGGHSVWQGQTPSTPQPGQMANQSSGNACGKLWVPSRNHWEVRCVVNPPTDGTFIPNQGGRNPSPQELRSTPPPAGGYAQTAPPVQPGQAQPPPTDANALVNQATNLWHSLTHK